MTSFPVSCMRETVKAFLLCFLIIHTCRAAVDAGSVSLGDILKKYGDSFDSAADFTVQKDRKKGFREKNIRSLTAEKNGTVIRIKIIDKIDGESALRYIEDREYEIGTLYRETHSPYPGMISNAIDIPDELMPKRVYVSISGEDVPVILLTGTPRFTYGATAEELVRYRGGKAFFHCRQQKRLYEVELFIPKEDYTEKMVLDILRSFSCSHRSHSKKKKPKPERYNLVMIGFEPLGANHVSACGYGRQTTPNMDRFAARSYLFSNAISPSSWTLPVFMSCFTSMYPSEHRLVNKFSRYTDREQVLSRLPQGVLTFAEVLGENGYSTAGFTGDAGVNGEFGYRRGFDVYHDIDRFAGFDSVMPMALDWIKRHKDKPFFLFIQGYDVHGRYRPESSTENRFGAPGYKGRYKGTIDEYWSLRNRSVDGESPDLDMDDIGFWRDLYDSRIYDADVRFGGFIGELERSGLAENTAVVVFSGSGNEFFEHGRIDHGFSLYDELLRVPLIIHVPGHGSRRIDDQVRIIDIMPTMLELMGVKRTERLNRQMRGVSLVPLMKGEEMNLDAYSETDYLLSVFKRSVRTTEGWKFIYSMDTEKRELYDLNKDPAEKRNLVKKERKVAYELEQKLFSWMRSMGQDTDHHRRMIDKVLGVEKVLPTR